MITICFANQKGGVSKTTSAAEVATILAARQHRTLAVDMDPQGNLTDIFGIDVEGRDSVYELLKGEAAFADVVSSSMGVDVIPSDIALAMLEPELAGTSLGREHRLSKALSKCAHEYDFCIIDCPPSLGLLATMALTASGFVVVPVTASLFAAKGIIQLSSTVEMVREYANADLKIAGVLFSKYHAGQINSADILEVASVVAESVGTRVFESRIREAVEVERAHNAKCTISLFNPAAKPALDYQAFVDELLMKIGVDDG